MPTPEDLTTIDQKLAAIRGEQAVAKKDDFQRAVQEARGHEDVDTGVIADKQLRVHFDLGLQQLKALPPSRHRALAITHIEDAIMRLGLDLKRLNDTRPYPDSMDPTNAKVEPTADGLKL